MNLFSRKRNPLSQHFGLRAGKAKQRRRFFRAGVILERRERQVIRDSREAELSKAVWRGLPTALQNAA
jgi:hypothetical protein